MLLAAILSLALAAPTGDSDAAKLLEGVTTIERAGVPGPIAVFGEKSFAVVSGASGGAQVAVIACGRLGGGRVVAFGHNGYGGAAKSMAGETALLQRNLLAWAARSKARTIRAGAHGGAFKALFAEAGFDVVELARGAKPDNTDKLALIGCSPLSLSSDEAKWLEDYASGGGAILCGDTPWGWKQLNAGKEIDEQPGQRLLAKAGLAYADGYVEATADGGRFAARAPSELLNASRALDALVLADAGKLQLAANDASQAERSLQLALRWMPEGDWDLREELERLVERRRAELVPTESAPIRENAALVRALVAVQLERMRRTEMSKLTAHPAAADFPGDVEATPVVRMVQIDASVSGWHSTGLYARPGARIELELPAAARQRGLRGRIGCHADSLWHLDAWKRMPEVTTEFALERESTLAISPFGGLVYVVAPEGCTLGTIDVQIRGAIPAPLFTAGKTSLDEWRASIRARPGPWAELESSKLVITVPSSAVRALEDPAALMAFWDRVLDAQAELVGIDAHRPRPERFVCDRQISAGYMHSGYPVMMHLDVPELLVSLPRLESGEEIWGFVHELGHNLQRPEWTFDGTGEVTNNVIALYAIEKCCKLPEGKHGHGGVDSPPSFEAYSSRGAKFGEWKSDPFLALSMYVQLRRGFGWEPFRRVFGEYRDLGQYERPQSDDERRDQWLVRMSRATGKNLGPFFETWGVPTSEAARRTLADLPEWMPEGFPKRD
jgi:hypothetical protein